MAKRKRAKGTVATKIAASLPDFLRIKRGSVAAATEVHSLYVDLLAQEPWMDFAGAAMDVLGKHTKKLPRTEKVLFLLAVAAYAGHKAGAGA